MKSILSHTCLLSLSVAESIYHRVSPSYVYLVRYFFSSVDSEQIYLELLNIFSFRQEQLNSPSVARLQRRKRIKKHLLEI